MAIVALCRQGGFPVQIPFDENDYATAAVLEKGIALLTRLRDAASRPTQNSAKDASASAPPVPAAPSLQMKVLCLLADSPTGSLTSYDVAEKLGMSQPDFAAKIRGTGKAAEQAQDTLYLRGWTFQDGKRVRVYTITDAGRQMAEMLK